jgi:hypothetical protein
MQAPEAVILVVPACCYPQGSHAVAKKPVIVNPGQKAPASGQYRPVKGGPEVTIPKGHRVPPTPNGGPQKLVDPTKNKSGK